MAVLPWDGFPATPKMVKLHAGETILTRDEAKALTGDPVTPTEAPDEQLPADEDPPEQEPEDTDA